MARDYYEVLSVSKNATADELKKAYRKSAMKYHPDRNSGDKDTEKKFKEAQKAYEILSNPQKRTLYDQYGHDGVQGMRGGGSGRGGGAPGFGGFGDFSSVFDDIFGGDIFGGRQHGSVQQGQDYEYHLELTFKEAVKGVQRDINVNMPCTCDACNGSGAKKGSSYKACATCNGSGQMRFQQGFFSVQQTCSECHGRGKTIAEQCPDCGGAGQVNKSKKLEVKIPAGVNTGDRINLRNEGGAGLGGGNAGNLYVLIDVKPHPMFKRADDDLLLEIPISFISAALGDEIEVPTLGSRLKLKIPPGTQTGKQFRLRGKGVKSVRHHAVGDMICRVTVETPVHLTSKQKELFQEIRVSLGKNAEKHSPKNKSWFDDVKSFFRI